VPVRVLLDVSAVPSEPRGAGRYILELARHLAVLDAPDLDLVLLSRRDDTDRWVMLEGRSGLGGRPATTTAVDGAVPGPRPVRLAWEQAVGPRTARRNATDVWHGPHYTVPLHMRTPRVVTVHDLTLLEHPEWHVSAKARFFGRMIPAAVARAEVCVCVSHHTARRLVAVVPVRAGDSPRDVVVIPHGVDHERFRPEPDSAADLEALAALGVQPPYVAFVGTIEPRKDVPSLVHAFARVASTLPDLRLVLAGGVGWDATPVHDAIVSSGVAHRIVRTGFIDDDLLPALMRRAAVFVYPSLEEGFGLPALEALACAAPVVTTSGSSIEEFVGDAAILVPPGDSEVLADALRRALDPMRGAEMARLGPAQAAPYTWEAVARAHLDVYRRVDAVRQR
jgi:glycosyltransferase involved in cell wall biosynthesis